MRSSIVVLHAPAEGSLKQAMMSVAPEMPARGSMIQPFTGGHTVRQWLSTQPLEAQRQFGFDVLLRFGAAG